MIILFGMEIKKSLDIIGLYIRYAYNWGVAKW